MKKRSSILTALALSISLLTPSNSQATLLPVNQVEAPVKTTVDAPLYETSSTSIEIQQKKLLPRDFRYILLNEVSPKEYKAGRYTVETKEEFFDALNEVGATLPSYVFIKSNTFSVQELKAFYREYSPTIEENVNWHNLANYKLENGNLLFILVDKSDRNNQYSAKQYEEAFNIFTARLAEHIKGETDEESVKNLYDYIYKNFKYNAEGATYMNITNIAAGSMACNGFSRLVNDTLAHLNISTEIRAGESHYWNLVAINDVTTTFDVTTDMVLRKPYLTLGNDADTHFKNSTAVRFFNAAYKGPDTVAVNAYDFLNDDNPNTRLAKESAAAH